MILLIITLLIAIALLWYWFKNPLSSLQKGPPQANLIEDKSYEESDGRVFHDIILDSGGYGEARFSVSLPQKIPNDGVPTALIVDGLDTGRNCLKLISNHGNYALISFEYPTLVRSLKSSAIAHQLFSVRRAVLNVPGQLLSIARWVEKQSWNNKEPLQVMGVSFGVEFVPAFYHMAKIEGITLGPTVLAQGGAGLYRLIAAFEGNPVKKFFRGLIGALLFHPLEPGKHLPHIESTFLIISATHDQVVPDSSAKLLQELVPNPKTIVNLDTPHVLPDNHALIERLVKISREWLEEQRPGKTRPN